MKSLPHWERDREIYRESAQNIKELNHKECPVMLDLGGELCENRDQYDNHISSHHQNNGAVIMMGSWVH